MKKPLLIINLEINDMEIETISVKNFKSFKSSMEIFFERYQISDHIIRKKIISRIKMSLPKFVKKRIPLKLKNPINKRISKVKTKLDLKFTKIKSSLAQKNQNSKKLKHKKIKSFINNIQINRSMFNSLNGTRSFILIISYVYEICTNGLGHNLWDVHISKRHSSKKELVLETNAKQLCNLHQVSSKLNDMCELDMTSYDMESHTDKLCFQPTHKDRSHVNQQCKKYILDEYDSYSKRYGKNLFSAYQAWTHWATHYPSASINTVYDRQRKVAGMKVLN